jgi:hypothetical protein
VQVPADVIPEEPVGDDVVSAKAFHRDTTVR